MANRLDDGPEPGPEPEPGPAARAANEFGWGMRLGLMLAAWMVVYVVLSVLAGGPVSPRMVVFFPVGLVVFLDLQDTAAGGLLMCVVGWALYLGLTIGMLRTKRSDTYIMLVLVLCLLLALNVSGCVEYWKAFP
jgi:hypothetical protein